MKIGLLDVDCSASKKHWGATIYPNIAIAKIAAYHKQRGDEVEWATPFEHYGILYRSKIFNFTPDDLRVYSFDREVRGGTGYDVASRLPQEIDDMQPDLSIYPNIPDDVSFGFLTRGCPNRCKWCVVPRKEGAIVPYWDIERVANGRKNVVLLDNNILAAGDYAIEQLDKIIRLRLSVDFNQALDARLVTDEFARRLAKIKWFGGMVRFGCDTHAQIAECERAMELMNAHGFKGSYFLYTMLNDNFRESFERVNYWHDAEQQRRNGLHKTRRPAFPNAQPYRDPLSKNTPPMAKRHCALD